MGSHWLRSSKLLLLHFSVNGWTTSLIAQDTLQFTGEVEKALTASGRILWGVLHVEVLRSAFIKRNRGSAGQGESLTPLALNQLTWLFQLDP